MDARTEGTQLRPGDGCPETEAKPRDGGETARALVESERKYRELVEHANSIILRWTRDGRIVFLNEFGQRFFGYTEEEIRGRHVIGTIVPETEEAGRDLRPLMDEICQNPAAFEQNVNENVRRSGERVWVAWTNKVVLDPEGQVSEILSIGADITERKRAESRILRLNHLYAALSRLNQTIVRAADRDTLFRETCHIAVEHGQFRMAWIGLIDEGTERLVPVAVAGDEHGYLSNVKITPNDEVLGRGPTGTAVREGHCVLCQDIATDPGMVPWRAACLERGFRSSASVPIRQGNRVIGALTAYAGEPQWLDAEEESLVVEIGQAISYALDGLVHEGLRRQAEENLRQLNVELERRVDLRTAELNAINNQLRVKNEELKSFAYTVSHDLKAPLRGIAGYAGELDRKHRVQLSERAHFCLTQILTGRLPPGPTDRGPAALLAHRRRDPLIHGLQSERPRRIHSAGPRAGRRQAQRERDGGHPHFHDVRLGTRSGSGHNEPCRQRHQVQSHGQPSPCSNRGRVPRRCVAIERHRQRDRIRHEVQRPHLRIVQPPRTHGRLRRNRRRSGHRQEGLGQGGRKNMG